MGLSLYPLDTNDEAGNRWVCPNGSYVGGGRMKKDDMGWAWKDRNVSSIRKMGMEETRLHVIKLLNGHEFDRNTTNRQLAYWLVNYYGKCVRMAGLKKSHAANIIRSYGENGPSVFNKFPTIEEDKVNKKATSSKKAAYKAHKEFYQTDEWRRLRYQALIKLGRKCQCCGAKPPAVILHVDHIKPRSKYPELELDLSNLQILCEDCNLGKSNLDDTDFR